MWGSLVPCVSHPPWNTKLVRAGSSRAVDRLQRVSPAVQEHLKFLLYQKQPLDQIRVHGQTQNQDKRHTDHCEANTSHLDKPEIDRAGRDTVLMVKEARLL